MRCDGYFFHIALGTRLFRDRYVLLSTAIYYFPHYIRLLALHDCDFVRAQGFPAIRHLRIED